MHIVFSPPKAKKQAPSYADHPRPCTACGVVYPPEEYVAGTALKRTTVNPAKCSRCRKPLGKKQKISLLICQHSQRATKLGVANTFTASDWVSILDAADGTCSYCRERVGRDMLSIDHITPMSKGGANTAENVAAACAACNARKAGHPLTEDLLVYLRMRSKGFDLQIGLDTLEAIYDLRDKLGCTESEVIKLAVQALAGTCQQQTV